MDGAVLNLWGGPTKIAYCLPFIRAPHPLIVCLESYNMGGLFDCTWKDLIVDETGFMGFIKSPHTFLITIRAQGWKEFQKHNAMALQEM